MDGHAIPKRTAARFPVYLRSLQKLRARGDTTISSKHLAEDTHNSPAQIRKDLSFIGELGTRGLGYDIDYLIAELQKRLSLTKSKALVVIGTHINRYPFWQTFLEGSDAFELVGLFECSDDLDELWYDGIPIYRCHEIYGFLALYPVDIAIIADASACPDDIVGQLSSMGIRAVLNLTQTSLKVPPGILCRQIDLSSELQLLSYYIAEGSQQPRLPVFEHV